MNNKKIAFIICSNNKLYLNECLHYISCLNLPDGFETDVITIEGATGINKAYNEAMLSSDAKYKVYMHQDLFIINRNFISDILKIFENKDIGMIGFAGIDIAKNFFKDLKWTYGTLYNNLVYSANQEIFSELDDSYVNVQSIDGMIMVTQYDIPWREDKYTGWHFYDHVHSLEFLKRGYQLVVPTPKEPWVFHDCGIVNLDNYLYWKNIFLEENADFLEQLANTKP